MSKIYAGTSAFVANRTGNHNWFDNNKRPFISLISTGFDGKRTYKDLFLNTDACDVKVAKTGKVTITFDAKISKPLFRALDKGDNA